MTAISSPSFSRQRSPPAARTIAIRGHLPLAGHFHASDDATFPKNAARDTTGEAARSATSWRRQRTTAYRDANARRPARLALRALDLSSRRAWQDGIGLARSRKECHEPKAG